MTNVLIVVDTSESSFWLAYYAMGLTHRISAKVFILMIDDEEYVGDSINSDEWIGLPEKRLESLLAENYSGPSHLDYYVANGKMENEIPQFVEQNAISTVFIGKPQGKNHIQYTKFIKMVEAVNRKMNCNVEIVQKVSVQSRR